MLNKGQMSCGKYAKYAGPEYACARLLEWQGMIVCGRSGKDGTQQLTPICSTMPPWCHLSHGLATVNQLSGRGTSANKEIN